MTGCKWDTADSSVLPFALAGSFGWRYRGNSCLVESGRDFVDVEQGEEREYQAGTERKKERESNGIKYMWRLLLMLYKVDGGVCDLRR